MKKITLLTVLFMPLWLIAQIPSYYNDVNLTLTGTSLKDELATKVINTHTLTLSYSQVWDASKVTDLDPDDGTQSNVILVYGYNDSDGNYITDRTRDKNLNGGTSGTDWNREHTYPKSLGTPNLGTSGPGADAHHLRPADVTFNGQRGSLKFAIGSGNAGISNGGWYPGDEWKGDIARMMMYMYIRYGSQCLPNGVGIGSNSGTPDDMIDLFLQWNAEDPVSQIEKNRNVYHGNSNAFAQGNRNPFIDNPAFATQIWGGPQAEDLFGSGGTPDTESPTLPSNLVASNTTSLTTDLNWNSSTDNIGVSGYDIYKDGAIVGTSSTTSYNVTGLSASTTYSFTVKAKDAAGNTSGFSNSVSVTTLTGSGNGSGSELFISEYVEGSSNNKAIEIANFTGSTLDLSVYSLKRNTNGGSSWGTALNLSGQLSDQDVYVIANSSATTSILSVTDLTTSASAMTFNGNDPVGLFKNNVLIDIVGTFNGGSGNFAQNETLRRKETITDPSTTFNKTADWDVFSTDTFDGLGSHTTTGGTPTDTEAPSSPTNLSSSNITETSTDISWNAATDNVGVTGYDIYQNGNLIASTASTSYNVTGLTVVTTYTFTVIAKDAAGNNSISSNSTSVTTVDTTAPSVPTNLSSANTTQTSTELTWNTSTDNVAVTDYEIYQNGSLISTVTNNSFNVTGLAAETSYTFTVKAKDAANNVSSSSNSLNVTTLANPVNQIDLLISEYVEGSSNNKAIEIANITGSTVDLSLYSLKRNTNGGTTWGAALNLSGNLTDGAVYVIANSSATSTILNVANLTTSSDAMVFNGNDPVGLFKNNVLIDIVGTFNGGSGSFAADTTLRRLQTVTNPNTTYTTSEWESFSTDTFDGLGTFLAPTSVTDILLSHSFETGWDGWIDGGSDSYRINSSRSFDGNYSIRLRDNTGIQSAMTSASYDVSSYDNLEVKFNYYSYSMESNEDFWLQYYDGSTWSTVKAFVSNIDFTNNAFNESIVNIPLSSYTFPANAQFRFQCDASSNADQIYIDNVVITATFGVVNNSSSKSSFTKSKLGTSLDIESNQKEIEDLEFYPNPAANFTRLRTEIDTEDEIVDAMIHITNIQGRTIQSIKINNIENEMIEENLDISHLPKGIYFVKITSSKGLNITKKLLVK